VTARPRKYRGDQGAIIENKRLGAALAFIRGSDFAAGPGRARCAKAARLDLAELFDHQ
jgi:hypothetical protein